MAGQHEDDLAVTPGSGNVFADLGVAEPEEELAKAQLAAHIRDAIKRRRLTQAEAARRHPPRAAPGSGPGPGPVRQPAPEMGQARRRPPSRFPLCGGPARRRGPAGRGCRSGRHTAAV